MTDRGVSIRGGLAVVVSVLASCLALGVFGGCRESTGGASVDESSGEVADGSETSGTGDRAGWPERVRFGLVPSEGGTDIVDRFAPFTAFLSERLGVPVESYSASAYIGVITAMQNRQVDVAYFGPKSYVEAARVAGAEAVASEITDGGEPGYHSVIVVHKDSAFMTLDDTRGQVFAFVAPNSTSGYLVPTIGIIRETGERPEDFFGEVLYTGSHGSSMARVSAGDVPVAATNTNDMRAMDHAGLIDASVFREIWRSARIPSSPIAVRGDLPQSFKEAVRTAVLAFNSETEVLAQMSRHGFEPATDADYDIVRVLEQRKDELVRAVDDG